MLFPFSFMQSQSAFDPDAQAFFDRVTAAGGTLSATEKTAVNTLVIQLKADGNWTPMKAIYPMVGASAAACAQNLKSSSFTGSFSSGWTFSSGGVQGNGTSSFMNTNLPPNGNFTQGSSGLTVYKNIAATFPLANTTRSDLSATAAPPTYLPIFYMASQTRTNIFEAGSYSYNISEGQLNFTQTFGTGFFQSHRTSTTLFKAYRSGSVIGTNTNSNTAYSPNITNQIYIGATNLNGTAVDISDARFAFVSMSDGLTDTQASNFYTAVQTFNQTLNRQVGAQIVSDADAQAYIDRVYTAGGTLTNTEANAVNQLVIDMKAAGIWTAMKAVYPMVGSSAASCAQNLKSSSFTGSFSSGWTFASTGATPNGTSAYMDTGLVPNTNLSQNSSSGGSYINSLSAGSVNKSDVYFGASNSGFVNGFYLLPMANADNKDYSRNNTDAAPGASSWTDCRGFYQMYRTVSTSYVVRRNNTQTTYSIASVSPTTFPVWIAALNNAGTLIEPSSNTIALSYFGDGLTDTQAADFYTCVQTFNTTLSRQV